MIAGDVRVQILPQSLDPVGIRAIGRQEVQPDLRPHLLEQVADELRLVDHVVVEDHVDDPRPAVGERQGPQQVEEHHVALRSPSTPTNCCPCGS